MLTWIVNKVSRTILKAGFVVVAFLVTGQVRHLGARHAAARLLTDFVKIALATDRVRAVAEAGDLEHRPAGAGRRRRSALLMLVEALGLLAVGWHRFGLVTHPGRLQTFTFQTFLFFALFSLLSVRERRAFWRSRPSAVLAASLGAAAVGGVLIGLVGVAELSPLPFAESALIFGYAALCTLGLNDLVKSFLTARAVRARLPGR